MSRTLVIGDIHGGLIALQQITQRANIASNDTLIFLGDYVDGWSQSPQVIDFLIALQKTNSCIFIKGNHDDLLLDWLIGDTQNFDEKMWFQHGGKTTAIAYATISKEKKHKHVEFLQNLQNYYLDNQNRLFVHAGFTNMKGIEHEYFSELFYWDRTLWETAVSLNPNLKKNSPMYPARLKIYAEVYIGHTPTTHIGYDIPKQFAGIFNIDTGAAFTGKLSILDINSKQFWQSDALPSLYPNEKGRN